MTATTSYLFLGKSWLTADSSALQPALRRSNSGMMIDIFTDASASGEFASSRLGIVVQGAERTKPIGADRHRQEFHSQRCL
jgi:hypothetical protein